MSRRVRRSFCNRHLTSDDFFARRELSPLIKAIHPDMFVRESITVQRTNLSCLQALNEMCDSIEGLRTKSDDVFEVSKPLKLQYVFQCYLHVRNQSVKEVLEVDISSEQSGTKAVQVILKTPPQLCTRHRISPQTAKQAVDVLLLQLAPFFNHADLVCPFKIGSGENNQNEKVKMKEETFFMEERGINLRELQKLIDAQTAENYLIRKDRAIRSSTFVSSNSNSRDAKKYQWLLMNEEVCVCSVLSVCFMSISFTPACFMPICFTSVGFMPPCFIHFLFCISTFLSVLQYYY